MASAFLTYAADGRSSLLASDGLSDGEGDPIGFRRRLLPLGALWRCELDQHLRRSTLIDISWRPILLPGKLDATLRQSELLRLLDMDAPTLARLLETFERAELVGHVEDPQDRCARLVQITASGRTIQTQVRALAIEPATCCAGLDRIDKTLRRIGTDPSGKTSR